MISTYSWPPFSVTTSSPATGINGNPAPAQSTQIAGEDGSGNLQPVAVDTDGHIQADILTIPLAAGAATEAKQDAQIVSLDAISASLDLIEGDTAVLVGTDFSTSAKQDLVIAEVEEANVTLAALNAKLASSLVPEKFDEIAIAYVGATTAIDTVVYKQATVTVATLQLGYDLDNRLTSVVRS